MTVYGVGVTDKDQVTTWADVDAMGYVRRPMPPAVAKAKKAMDEAKRVVDRMTDMFEGPTPELLAALQAEYDADREYGRLYDLWQANYNQPVLPAELMEA